MTFLGSRFWDSSDTSHGSHGSMTTRADAVFSFVSTRSGHFERQGWSGLVKAVFVIGALLCNRRSENRPHGGRLRPPVAEQN